MCLQCLPTPGLVVVVLGSLLGVGSKGRGGGQEHGRPGRAPAGGAAAPSPVPAEKGGDPLLRSSHVDVCILPQSLGASRERQGLLWKRLRP